MTVKQVHRILEILEESAFFKIPIKHIIQKLGQNLVSFVADLRKGNGESKLQEGS